MRAALQLPLTKKSLDEAADRLMQLADDCEERARRATDRARSHFHVAASEARSAARARHLGDLGRRDALEAITAFVLFIRWLDGECVPEVAARPMLPLAPQPVPNPAPQTITASLRNARQLSEAFGLSERGARKRIERGLSRNLAGFYRHGALLLAEPEAFASLQR